MQNIFNSVEEDFQSSRNGNKVVRYLKVEVVFVGELDVWEERLGGEEVAAWAPGSGKNLFAVAVWLAECH